MNILVLTSIYPYEKYPRPDSTWVVPYFARAWIKQGHKVLVIVNSTVFPEIVYFTANKLSGFVSKRFNVSSGAFSKSGWMNEFEFNDYGVEVINLPIMKLTPGGKFSNSKIRDQYNRILQLIDEKKFVPDVITGHWLNPQLFLIAKLKLKFGCQTALVFHKDHEKEKCEKFNVNKYIRYIDHVGCRSESACQSFSQYVNTNEPPFVCSSGIPDEYIADNSALGHTFSTASNRIISAGRLVSYKNFDKLIEACKMAFPDGDYHLSIAGDGPERELLESIILGDDLSDTTELLGKLSREDLQVKFRENDIFALISDNETMGLVYLEAMAQGCIVIGCYHGGIDGIIRNGENGFLCNQGDKEDLAKVLIHIVTLSHDERMSISSEAMKTAKKYTDSNAAKMYLDAITKHNYEKAGR